MEDANHNANKEHVGAQRPPKPELEVLSQLVDDEDGMYRVLAGYGVHYLDIPTMGFDENIMCRPWPLIPELPRSDTDRTTMNISQGAAGALEWTISYDPLPAIYEIGTLSLLMSFR
jgi:hypothetical protein